ncbi:unnamed protein product, partial [Mesorhabditis spiculigera]
MLTLGDDSITFEPSSSLSDIFYDSANFKDFVYLDNSERETCLEFTQVVVFVTNNGLELYEINESKKSSKLLKTLNVASDWSTCYHTSNLLLLATGMNAAILQPFIIQGKEIIRLKPFTVDFGCSNSKNKLLERDVAVASIYGAVYVLALRYSTRDSTASDLLMYRLPTDLNAVPQLRYTLSLGLTGMFGIHVIDNMVIVHHQLSKSSLVFDVGMQPNSTSHQPFLKTSLIAAPRLCTVSGQPPALYTPSWVMFAPNIVIDPTLGIFASLAVKPELAEIDDTVSRFRFLMNRSNQKKTILSELTVAIKENKLTVRQLKSILETITEKFVVAQIPVLKPSEPVKGQLLVEDVQLLCINQEEMMNVFVALREEATVSDTRLASTLLAYVSILQSHGLNINPYLLEILVNTLIGANEYAKLHQLLSYKVIEDSKPMAFLLLGFEAKYPPLFQSGVDMLAREGAHDEIIEVLLSKGNATDALRYLENNSALDKSNALKALDSAWSSGDRIQQHVIFQYCLEKKGRQNWGESFEKFSRDFRKLYRDDELQEGVSTLAFSRDVM